MATALEGKLRTIIDSMEICNENIDTIVKDMPYKQYQELEYIQSTGTQWIDTLVKCKDTLKFQTKFSTQIHTGGNYFGHSGGGEEDSFRFFSYATPNTKPEGVWYLDYGSGDGEGYNRIFGGIATLNTVYEFEVGNRYIKDMVSGLNIISNTAVTFTNKIYNFCIANGGSQLFIYYLKLYDGNTLIRDMIPAKRLSDNCIGMIDKLDNTFYSSLGDMFIAGPEKASSSIKELEKALELIKEEKETKILSENIRAGVSILGIDGTLPTIFETEEEMQLHIDYPDQTLALLYNSNLNGVYILVNKQWIKIGEPTEEVLAMIDLNNVNGTNDTYTGLGDTIENINKDLDDILGS